MTILYSIKLKKIKIVCETNRREDIESIISHYRNVECYVRTKLRTKSFDEFKISSDTRTRRKRKENENKEEEETA